MNSGPIFLAQIPEAKHASLSACPELVIARIAEYK